MSRFMREELDQWEYLDSRYEITDNNAKASRGANKKLLQAAKKIELKSVELHFFYQTDMAPFEATNRTVLREEEC